MPYNFLADVVITTHFFWIVFLIFGAIPGARWKPVKYLHLSGLLFAFIIQTSHSYCPLTTLESWLEARGALITYSGSFIGHYLDKIIYINAPEWIIVGLTWILCVFNVFVYLWRPLLRKGKRVAADSSTADIHQS